jgi:protocatechuate 3,4-dioxygenase beta subunit
MAAMVDATCYGSLRLRFPRIGRSSAAGLAQIPAVSRIYTRRERPLRCPLRSLILGLLVCLVVAPGARAQTAVARVESIRGQVIDASNTAPLRRARITVSFADRQVAMILTGDDGRFAIANLPSTSLTVRASKAGYAPAVVTIAAGSGGSDVGFALPKSAAVMGRVLDVNRARISGAFVIARLLLADGQRAPATSARFMAPTDALGDYRLAGLPAGRYEITAVRVPPERRAPGTRPEDQLFGSPEMLDTASGAVTVALAGGDEARDVDFTIPAVEQTCLAGPSSSPSGGADTAAISGRVIAASGEPLVCATVRVVAPDVGMPSVFTDRQGRYWIEDLPAGSFLLEARQSGYIALQYGQRTPSDVEAPVTLRNGERRSGIDIVLPRESVVTGMVIDEHGEPVEGMGIQALQIRRIDGRLTATSSALFQTTDDRGQYRVSGLRPGIYVVAAMAPRATVSGSVDTARGYAAMYYPGTADAATAQRITLDAGRDATGIDIAFTPTLTATVSGSVIDDLGRPFAGRVAMFTSARSDALSVDAWAAPTDATGAFVLRNVPRGDYVVKALSANGAVPFGLQYVSVVDGDPAPVRVTVSGGATLEGRVLIEGSPETNIGALTVSVAPADFDYTPPPPQLGQMTMFGRENDGTFRAMGIIGPSRVLAATPGCEHCYVKAAYVNGTDAADRPFDFAMKGGVYRDVEVIVSDGGATIEGHAVDNRDARVMTYAVAVFPVDRTLWYSRSRHIKGSRAAADGSFRVTGLPPGEYVVAAVSRLEFGVAELTDVDVLEQLATRGQRITVAERERKTLSLRLIRR